MKKIFASESRLGRYTRKLADLTLAFYISYAILKLIQGLTYVHRPLTFASMLFQSGDLLFTGSTFWLLLKSAAVVLSVNAEKNRQRNSMTGEKVQRDISQLLFWLGKFVRIFPFVMTLVSLPEIFRLYQVSLSFGLTSSRLFAGGMSLILGGGLVALQIGFWYLILRSVEVILKIWVDTGKEA